VRGAWLRHDLDTFQERLKALEARVAQDGLILMSGDAVVWRLADTHFPALS